MSDLYGKVTDDQDILRKLMSKIPGFSGYIERGNRRDADKLLRESIAERYEAVWKKVGNIQKDLASQQELEYIDDLDGATTKMRTFIDKVRGASYGYSGFFDAVKIKEDALKRIYEYDLTLVDGAETLSAAVAKVEAAIGTEEMEAAVKELVGLSRDLVASFEKRDEVITAQESTEAQ
jgi:hypothetical protein